VNYKDQIFEPIEKCQILDLKVVGSELVVKIRIPKTPYCCLGDQIDQAVEPHNVELHMGPHNHVMLLRRPGTLRRPRRQVMRSNWPQVYTHVDQLIVGDHEIRLPIDSLVRTMPVPPVFTYLDTKNKPTEPVEEGKWFVKLYVGNSKMQFVSQEVASVDLPEP